MAPVFEEQREHGGKLLECRPVLKFGTSTYKAGVPTAQTQRWSFPPLLIYYYYTIKEQRSEELFRSQEGARDMSHL
jgi:hypothetical protein